MSKTDVERLNSFCEYLETAFTPEDTAVKNIVHIARQVRDSIEDLDKRGIGGSLFISEFSTEPFEKGRQLTLFDNRYQILSASLLSLLDSLQRRVVQVTNVERDWGGEIVPKDYSCIVSAVRVNGRNVMEVQPVSAEEYVDYGQGTVLRIRCTDGEEYILKAVPFPKSGIGREKLVRATKEVKTLRTFESVNGIPRIQSMGVLDHPSQENAKIFYFVMDCLKGRTINEAVKSPEFEITPLRTIEVIEQLLRILGQIHQHGYIFNDVQPRNVIIDENFTCRLVDFGFCSKNKDVNMTGGYAPPGAFKDWYKGGEAALWMKSAPDVYEPGPHVDIYGAGVLLHLLLTGRPLKQLGRGRLIQLEQIRLGLTGLCVHALKRSTREMLVQILQKATHHDYRKCYQTTEEMLADLERLKERIPEQVIADLAVPWTTEEESAQLYSHIDDTVQDTKKPLYPHQLLRRFPGLTTIFKELKKYQPEEAEWWCERLCHIFPYDARSSINMFMTAHEGQDLDVLFRALSRHYGTKEIAEAFRYIAWLFETDFTGIDVDQACNEITNEGSEMEKDVEDDLSKSVESVVGIPDAENEQLDDLPVRIGDGSSTGILYSSSS